MYFRDVTKPGTDDRMTTFWEAIPEDRRELLRAQVQAALDRQARDDRGELDDGFGDGRDDALAGAVDGWMDDQPDEAFDVTFDEEPVCASEHAAGTLDPPAPPLAKLKDEEARAAADLTLLAALEEQGRQVLQHPARRLDRVVRDRSERAEPDSSAARASHIIRLSEVQPERVHWLSRGRLAAGKITILDGDPGLGKSTLLCELAARITRGEALPDGEPGEPRMVVMMSAEDDLRDTIRPRLDAAGGNPEKVVAFSTMPASGGDERPFLIPGDVAYLELLVHRMRAALVIVDPFVAFLDGRLSANNDQDVRRALASLKGVAERTGAAIVAVRHLNKTASAKPLYRGGGSIGIIGAARCGLMLAADPENPDLRILAPTKGNLARPPSSLAFRLVEVPDSDVARVVWIGESRWSAQALLAASEHDDGDRSALDEAREWLREALAEGPRPARELTAEAQARGISTATLKRARQAEAIMARKDRGSNGGWSWALPDPKGEAAHATPLEFLEPLEPLEPLR